MSYQLGLPQAGRWHEIFNSDVYDEWVNSAAVGNYGNVEAVSSPMHGLNASARLNLPANGFVDDNASIAGQVPSSSVNSH